VKSARRATERILASTVGQWRLKTSTLARLREDIETPAVERMISQWLKRAMSKALPRAAGAPPPEWGSRGG